MKTLEEQIKEVLKRLENLENNLTERSEFEPCCTTAECDCGCIEPETITEDEGPQFDSAGFSEADREQEEDEPKTITFTQDELIEFSIRLIDNMMEHVNSAVRETYIDCDSLVELELSYDKTIGVDIDERQLFDAIVDQIKDGVDYDESALEIEIDDVLRVMEHGKSKS